MDNTTVLHSLIKESIQEYIREIEKSGNIAAQEAKIYACEEAIANREKKANMEGLDEAYHDLMDSAKMSNIKKEIKELQKFKNKAEKVLQKMKDKATGKKVVSDKETEDAPVDETDVTAEMELDEASKKQTFKVNNLQHGEKHRPFKKLRKEKPGTNRTAPSNQTDNEEDEPFNQGKTKNQPMDETMINESFLKMQKLAGLITEGQMRKMLTENEDYTPPAYEAINDLMDYIFQDTGMHGDIKPYRSISWLPKVSPADENMDMLFYKKGNQEIAIGADDVYQDTYDENFNAWVISSNDPSLDFGEYSTFDEVVDQVSNWLKS